MKPKTIVFIVIIVFTYSLSFSQNKSYEELDSLRFMYKTKGEYKKAKKYADKALDLSRELYGITDTIYIASLTHCAYLEMKLGNFADSDSLYSKALTVIKEKYSDDKIFYGQATENYAVLLKKLGNYEKAELFYKKALELYKGTNYNALYITQFNLANLYVKTSQFEKAEKLYSEVEKAITDTISSDYFNITNAIGSAFYNQKKYKEAIFYYKKALKTATALNNNSYKPIIMTNLGLLYEKTGLFEKAIELYTEATKIDSFLLGTMHQYYSEDLNLLSCVNYNLKNYNKSILQKKQSIDILNKTVLTNFSFLSEKEQEMYYKLWRAEYEGYYSLALLLKEEHPSLVGDIYNSIIFNKGILLKSSTAVRNSILSSNNKDLIQKYNNWIILKKKESKLFSTPVEKRVENIELVQEESNKLEKELVKSSKLFESISTINKLSWNDIQSKLKSNEAVIEFVRFKYWDNNFKDTINYCALIITPDIKYPKMIPLFQEKQLEAIIGKFGGNNYNYINNIYGKNEEVKTQLYNLIWAPIDSFFNASNQISKKKRKVFISPDGLLHKISFPAIAKKQNVYLCDVYDIEVKSSTAKIIESQEVTKSSDLHTATLFGGIDYNTDSTITKIWDYIEGTKTETQEINKILKKSKLTINYFSNTLATEEEFKIMAINSNIIHIATHGFFYPDPKLVQKETKKKVEYGDVVFRGGSRGFGVNSFVENENPLMRSGLVFAGANDVWSKQNKGNKEDGVLTALEVAHIDLRKTDLVVMSACETGLGDIKGSEGVYGLQRAFKMAGVKYEIMSLWQVPDNETKEFMTTFYKKLLKNGDINNAFSDTQKEMRKKYDPYFWAAFVLIE